jgi:hypothetical protein
MDIHKPKPWHSFREFLKEYLIIVVGVLTALAAEQAVEWLHWRHEVHIAREAIAFDMKRLVAMAAHKDAMSPCQAERMGGFSDALDKAQATHRLEALPWLGGPYTPNMNLRSWSGLTSGQTLAHMSNRDQIVLASIAARADYNSGRALAEREAWAVVQTMSGPGRPISDAEITSLRQALMHVSMVAADQRYLGLQLETMILRSGFLTRPEVEAADQEGLAAAKGTRFCGPVGPPPASMRDALAKNMTGPPAPPGKVDPGGEGVGGALTTER